MQLFKKLGLMLVMLVMVAQAQQSVLELFRAAKNIGDPVFLDTRLA